MQSFKMGARNGKRPARLFRPSCKNKCFLESPLQTEGFLSFTLSCSLIHFSHSSNIHQAPTKYAVSRRHCIHYTPAVHCNTHMVRTPSVMALLNYFSNSIRQRILSIMHMQSLLLYQHFHNAKHFIRDCKQSNDVDVTRKLKLIFPK